MVIPIRLARLAIVACAMVTGCVNIPDYTFAPFDEADADRRPEAGSV